MIEMVFMIGPNQARQRMKEDQERNRERTIFEDLHRGNVFQGKVYNADKRETTQVPIQPSALGGKVEDMRIKGRAKKGVFNQNRMGAVRF